MSNQLRQAVEKAREYYIEKLIEAGVYKHSEQQLYELTLSEMKQLYKKYRAVK
ncbi:Fur-regulated basic protein FbpA [Neobacillus sp. D3-1R]|uniref:Fur-regulated basic protein FbpA n=1 Tax=Neobacillus sp. D3-1R TaxID=3445778 RepID=UPI003FA05577